MKIYKLYEFLELQNIFEYHLFQQLGDFYIYEFKSNNDIYVVRIHHQKILNKVYLLWCNKEDFLQHNFDKIDFKTDPNFNINELFKIINTVFKISFDYMKKNNVKKGRISSRNRNKFKLYKKCIGGENDILYKDFLNGSTYHIDFEFK